MRLSGERLKATFRRGGEVMSPRQLRSTLDQLRSIIDAQVSEVEGGRRASEFARWYAQAKPEERRDCWWLMSEQFAPDAQLVSVARQQYEAALGSVDEGRAEMALRLALVSPRARLLQRFAAFENGVRFLVELRAQLLPHVKNDPRLLALDGELQGLFSTWFDVAFLELRSISWDSPASMLEKLIQYEAVHDIRGWGDLKNRLDSDRRCYGCGKHQQGLARDFLVHQQHPARSARGELWRLVDQAGGGNAQAGICPAQGLCHAVAPSRFSRLVDAPRRRDAGPAGRQGARVEQINWCADLSAKGLKQSFGMMVNYQYDLKRLDTYRAQFASGKMAVSSRVRALKL